MAAQKGWPVFVGVLGADLREQMRSTGARSTRPTIRRGEGELPALVLVRLGRRDVAETDEEALEREKLARAETMAIRTSYVKRHGRRWAGDESASAQSRPDAYAKGGDMKLTIAGTPDTIAAKVKQLADMGINHLHLRFIGEMAGETAHICRARPSCSRKK